MTTYQARARRNRDAWYDALLTDQSISVEGITLDDLRDFDAELQASGGTQALVAVDQPFPARGYALLFRVSPVLVAARIHMLADQPDEAYAALFSQVYVQADRITGQTLNAILVDSTAAAPHVIDAVARLGDQYLLAMHDVLEGEPVTGDDTGNVTGDITITEGDDPGKIDQLAASLGHYPSGVVLHNVLIDYNDETNVPKLLTVADGETIEQPSDPARPDGIAFSHWWAQNPDLEIEDGDNPVLWQYDFTQPVTTSLLLTAAFKDQDAPKEAEEVKEIEPEQPPAKKAAPRRAPAKRAPAKKATK